MLRKLSRTQRPQWCCSSPRSMLLTQSSGTSSPAATPHVWHVSVADIVLILAAYVSPFGMP